jgi:hypothetical protein
MTGTTVQKNVKETPKETKLLPVLVCAVVLPLSMTMWIGNLAFSFFTGGANAVHNEGKTVLLMVFLSLFLGSSTAFVCMIL